MSSSGSWGLYTAGFQSPKKHPPSLFLWLHASPRHELALAHELKHFARATTIQLGGENDSGGRLGVCGLVDSAAQIFCPTWQRKNPATWQRKQAGIDHKENQKVRKHEQRKAYCARAIIILLVEARAVHSRASSAHVLLLLASKEESSSGTITRSMCGVHAAPRSMCGVAGCGIYTRRASAAAVTCKRGPQ